MPSDPTDNASSPGPNPTRRGLPPPPRRFKVSRRLMNAGIVIAVLALGAAGGAGAYRHMQKSHPQSVLLLQPAPIAEMTNSGPVAVKGQVDEIFGNKFIIQDDSGRTLVDTGPRGEGGKLVTKGETITVKGRFENGFIHANVMTRADGTSEAFGPPKPPRHEHAPVIGPARVRRIDPATDAGSERIQAGVRFLHHQAHVRFLHHQAHGTSRPSILSPEGLRLV
jgi:hypothetical protein